MKRPSYILPLIIFSQFAGTSLWFAGNAVIDDLARDRQIVDVSIAAITNAVQFGFILGTLVFAVLAISDRFPGRWVFFSCALAGAASNASILFNFMGIEPLVLLRFLTGFFLAGIYPVGMKIASGWYEKGLGRALGYLVAALVIGTAFPHLLWGVGIRLSWQIVIIATSLLAIAGGASILLFVPDGPGRAVYSRFEPGKFLRIFENPVFRSSAFGYFGHMWELYAFWAFLPIWLGHYNAQSSVEVNVSLWTFAIIAIGAFGCIFGGLISESKGSRYVAGFYLRTSTICCMISPLFFLGNTYILGVFLSIWGMAVIGDSPQLSAMNAANAPRHYVGSALTIVNSLGFGITIFSIALVSWLLPYINVQYLFLVLAPGPLFGLWFLRR
ncbi:MAG: MFS transporter [Gammaproteobacteria bacterium]|nr:MFS transporter [Gammaproteobacteria bacterium]